MAVCPKCGKEIDHLRNYALMWRELNFRVEDGKPLHEPSGDIVFSEPVKEEYECPECGAVLFKAKARWGARLPISPGSCEVKEAEKKAAAFLAERR